MKTTNITGFKGVKKNGKRFQAQISLSTFGGRIKSKTYTIGLGSFKTPQEAYKTRVEYIKQLL